MLSRAWLYLHLNSATQLIYELLSSLSFSLPVLNIFWFKNKLRLATYVLCYFTEKKWTANYISDCDTFGNIFLLHVSVTGLAIWWESQKLNMTVPEIFTNWNTMKLFHQADSQYWVEEGPRVTPLKLLLLGLCERTMTLDFYHV